MLDGSAIARLLDGRLPALERCYERQLLRTPELEGRVLLSARLDASGHPREAHLEGALPEPLASCATRWLEQTAWPAPEGGQVRTQVLLQLRRAR